MLKGLSQPLSPFGGSSKMGLFLAVGLAILAGVIIFAALNSGGGSKSSSTGAAGALGVVTATQDIPAGVQITPGMVELSPVAEDSVLPFALGQPELAVGQYARIPILAGEQVVGTKLATAGAAGTGLSYIVPEGMRAMAVRVDKVIGAGGLLRPGDRVDVFAVLSLSERDPLTGETLRSGTNAVLVAQNIEVLAVEQELQNVLPGARGAETNADGTLVDQPAAQPTSSVATLALSPTEAGQILMAEREGAIRLAVRAPGDDRIVTLDQGALVDGSFAAAVDAISNDLPLTEDSSLSFVVPEGMRAMAVNVDKVIGAGGLVRPGDRVDILVVLQVQIIGADTLGLGEFSRAITLAQNVEVLSVEQALVNPETAEAVAAGGEDGAMLAQPAVQPEATVVTFALNPQDAQMILLAEEEGTIRLSVRAPGDDTIVDVKDTAFFSIANVTSPAELFTDSIRLVAE